MLFRRRRRRPREWVQYPCFVYGTLRHGEANYELLLRGRTLSEMPAQITGMALYSLRSFPIAIESGPESVVQGELMILHPAHYARVMDNLDRLEGYDPRADPQTGLYRREKRRVKLKENAEAWAWIYVGNPALLAAYPHELIPHGDWCRYRREQVDEPMDISPQV